MEKIKTLFPDYEVFNKTLKTYDDDVVRGIQKQELDHGRGIIFSRYIFVFITSLINHENKHRGSIRKKDNVCCPGNNV